MSKAENDSVKLSKDQIKLITETAAATAIEEYKKEAERDREERKDKRLYNTRLLMERYRGMKIYAEDAVYDAIQLDDDMELQTLIELMESKGDDGLLTVESIQARAVRTRIILTHINKMLSFYESECKSSGRREMERRWVVIEGIYISDIRRTIKEIANDFSVDERTIYRDINLAIQDLNALFFGYLN